jgi:transposase
LPQPKEALSAEHNRSEWKSWQEGLSVKITLPEELPPLRMLLVWDNLIGHLNAELLLWMFARGIMVLYTPLGGSWLNMTESIQRILVRRALSGEHPRQPEQIMEWLEATARGWNRDRTGIRRRLSGAVGALCDECALESGGILWEVAEPAREG